MRCSSFPSRPSPLALLTLPSLLATLLLQTATYVFFLPLPPLGTPSRSPPRFPTASLIALRALAGCGDIIRALNECHERGMLHKITGGCNGIKEQLNLCLREEVSVCERQRGHAASARGVQAAQKCRERAGRAEE